MEKPTWQEKLIIVLAFFIGLIANLAARKILPEILPESWAKNIDFIAVVIRIFISCVIVFVPIYIMHRNRRN